MIGLTSTAATATNDNFVYGIISSWSQNPGSSNYWYDKVWHNKVSFLQNLTVLRGVICREKGVICRNCETTHFQFCHSRFFRYHRGDKTWAHATHLIKLRDPVLTFVDTGTMPPTSPVFGFMGFIVLSSFDLFHTILATCSSHTGMSCRLFSGWFGASSRHKQYPTVVALESQLGIKLLRYYSGMIFQGHFSCSRNLPGAFFILRGWNFVLFAKRQKIAQVDVAGMYIWLLLLSLLLSLLLFLYIYTNKNIISQLYPFPIHPSHPHLLHPPQLLPQPLHPLIALRPLRRDLRQQPLLSFLEDLWGKRWRKGSIWKSRSKMVEMCVISFVWIFWFSEICEFWR